MNNLTLHKTEYKVKLKNHIAYINGPFNIFPLTLTNDNVITVRSHNGTFNFNLQNRNEVINWLDSLFALTHDQNIHNFKLDLLSVEPKNKSYVYIFCDKITNTPQYVGVKHSYAERYVYHGSSQTYTPQPGDIKYIVAKDLLSWKGIELENHIIKKLKDLGYSLNNNTPGALSNDQTLLNQLQTYEIITIK